MTKPNVADRIAELQAERQSRTEITADYVISGLVKVAERCMQEEAVTTADGPTGEYKFEHSGANKAYELLGKHLGLFVERKEISGPDGGDIKTDNLFTVEIVKPEGL